jgi:hypothetical protein
MAVWVPCSPPEQRGPAREFGRALGELGKRRLNRRKFTPDESARVDQVRELRRPPGRASKEKVTGTRGRPPVSAAKPRYL